jgi:tripartite-type tricarboxylate transporter receptor subunit TctC
MTHALVQRCYLSGFNKLRYLIERSHPMNLIRREFLQLAGAVAAATAAPSMAWAQTYPTRPVRIIVGYAAGGSNDVVARLTGRWLSERLGRPFVIENRPGAGTNTATETVIKAAPDGYTLLVVNPANAVNATLYERLDFVFLRDIAPVAGIIRQPLVLLLNPSVPAKTVPELIAYVKANPGRINMASGGNGSINHVAGELFKMMAGVDLVHVPYRGAGPALTDLLGGQVDLLFGGMASSVEHARGGKLRALAVTTAARSEALPDTPAVSEFVPGYEASDWIGLGAPKSTSAEVVETLNKNISSVLADAEFKARVAELGGTVTPGTPANFGKLIAAETEKWATVVKFAGIKPG